MLLNRRIKKPVFNKNNKKKIKYVIKIVCTIIVALSNIKSCSIKGNFSFIVNVFVVNK